MNNIDKEIKYQEYKFEKARNEEIITIINNFDKFMEKRSYRYLLLDFLTRENIYYKDVKHLTDTLEHIRPDLEQETWLLITAKFLNDLEESLKPTIQQRQGEEERKEGDEIKEDIQQAQGELYTKLYDYVSKDETLNRLHNGLTEIREEFTEERKEEITKAIKRISDYLMGDLKENFIRLIQSEMLFQARLTDLVKKPFFIVHDYPKTPSFDSKKDQSPMASHISSSMVSNPNYSMVSNPNQSINLSATMSNSGYLVN